MLIMSINESVQQRANRKYDTHNSVLSGLLSENMSRSWSLTQSERSKGSSL